MIGLEAFFIINCGLFVLHVLTAPFFTRPGQSALLATANCIGSSHIDWRCQLVNRIQQITLVCSGTG